MPNPPYDINTPVADKFSGKEVDVNGGMPNVTRICSGKGRDAL